MEKSEIQRARVEERYRKGWGVERNIPGAGEDRWLGLSTVYSIQRRRGKEQRYI
ncbi:hypothetical protein RHGRI_014765 [Rhododendron griersonianum]|uniref:Uncharacterized protein n=1 Tax=Rhododendron griersonianum TaxID=479676 RepID=A0AAV6KAN6_9ERIC|nr:hypothetical protein RHGRI_014765 [Rhododendron griersonianum]